jgi:hypothetical protein
VINRPTQGILPDVSNEGLDNAPIASGDDGHRLATWSRIESDAIVPMAAPNNVAKSITIHLSATAR